MSMKSILVNTLCGVLAAAGLAGCYVAYNHNQHQAAYNTKLADKVTDRQTAFNAIKYQQTTTQYVVSPKGKISKAHLDTMRTIKLVFKSATTWVNGGEYTMHRNQLHQFVTDPSFFAKTGLMNNQTDSSGNSALDQTGVKSKNNDVEVFTTNGNRYLVIVNNTFYSKKVDLQFSDNLKTTTTMFIVGGTGDKLNYVHQIPNVSTVSQLTGL